MSDSPVSLHAHPAHLIDGVDRLEFSATRTGSDLSLRYDLFGDVSRLEIPDGMGGERRHELWRTTCFEAFLRAEDAEAYVEFNFAPNADWAAYQFTRIREGRSDLGIPAPRIEVEKTTERLSVSVMVQGLSFLRSGSKLELGPTAIIEGKEGGLSYWALHHPSNKPDFHTSEIFKLNLD